MMEKYKKIYTILLILVAVVSTSVCFSYAFFANKNEQHGKLNIVVGDLKYELTSSDLVDGSITVSAGETKELTLTLTSLNSISSKYEIYYNLTNSNNVEVGYISTPASGTIGANEAISIKVGIKNKGTSSATVTFGLEKGLVNNEIVLASGNSLNEIRLCDYNIGYVWNFDYTGGEQTFTVPCEGTYKIETWGAQGGKTADSTSSGGLGGYTAGLINLEQSKKIYLYIGAMGSDLRNSSIFNNGLASSGGWNGGGSTDIRLTSGNWDDFDSIKSRIMVAGAGGTAYQDGVAGAGGGLIGYSGGGTLGGTQTSFGESSYIQSAFGIANGGCTGGNGYYPGAGATCASGSGGGSSFISGHNGCNAISVSSTSSNIIHTGSPNHYSGNIFNDTVMIDGKGYNWTNVKGNYVGQPQPDGTTAIGHSGNGYARITYISSEYDKPKVGDTWEFDIKNSEQVFNAPCSGTYKLETWGAQGGFYSNLNYGGYGGYSSGNIELAINNNLYINVGGMGIGKYDAEEGFGKTISGGYNGGGDSHTWVDKKLTGSGGGATHIATKSGLLSSLSDSINDVLIVSGGGGGTGGEYQTINDYHGGHAGGFVGQDGYSGGNTWYGTGGTQTSGGTHTAYVDKVFVNADFGQGESAAGFVNNYYGNSSGGGGGFYGGGAGLGLGGFGGGGSGYIGNTYLFDKAMYCYNCAESNEVSTKTISTTCHSSTPTANCAKEGNGYAKITLVSLD